MNRPLKILHIETGMRMYGGALQVLYLLRNSSGGREVQNVLVCPQGSDIGASAENLVSALYRVPMSGDLDIPFLFRSVGIIRREKPDIVHIHSRRGADVLGGLASKLSHTKCILTRRVDNPEYAPWARIKYRLYDKIITISDGIRAVLGKEGIPASKTVTVLSAVDTNRYDNPCDHEWFRRQFGLDDSARVCAVIAQFIRRKGHRYLLEAIPTISREVPATRFLFFGKGPLEEDLRSCCRDLDIEERVAFAGFRDDLERIMGCLDLIIHPALMEGLGVSLLQAAAAGVPIIGTRVGGIPEAVIDGVNGILIPPADAGSIARATVRLLKDHSLAVRMGEEGRRIARERFSIDAMVEGNLQVYHSLMEGEG